MTMREVDAGNGIETPIPTTLEEALVIIAQLKAQLASFRTENSRYNLGRHEGYAEGYQDGKTAPSRRRPRIPRMMPVK